MPQHASVISGTSTVPSICGKIVNAIVVSVDRHTEVGEQAGKALADNSFRPPRKPAARHVEGESISGYPHEPGDRRLPAALAAFPLVHPEPVMIDDTRIVRRSL